jgi:YggT family protein
MISAALWLFNNVIDLYLFIVLAAIILSWLIAFNVVNTRHPLVYQINRVLIALTEPVLRPIRRVIPAVGGMDFSPIVLFLVLGFIQRLVNNIVITGNVF